MALSVVQETATAHEGSPAQCLGLGSVRPNSRQSHLCVQIILPHHRGKRPTLPRRKSDNSEQIEQNSCPIQSNLIKKFKKSYKTVPLRSLCSALPPRSPVKPREESKIRLHPRELNNGYSLCMRKEPPEVDQMQCGGRNVLSSSPS